MRAIHPGHVGVAHCEVTSTMHAMRLGRMGIAYFPHAYPY